MWPKIKEKVHLRKLISDILGADPEGVETVDILEEKVCTMQLCPFKEKLLS